MGGSGQVDFARLRERYAAFVAEPLNRGRPGAYVRIVDADATIIDGPAGWLGVLNALWIRQLPLRTRQLRALRPAGASRRP
jgi:hypothetical protein